MLLAGLRTFVVRDFVFFVVPDDSRVRAASLRNRLLPLRILSPCAGVGEANVVEGDAMEALSCDCGINTNSAVPSGFCTIVRTGREAETWEEDCGTDVVVNPAEFSLVASAKNVA